MDNFSMVYTNSLRFTPFPNIFYVKCENINGFMFEKVINI